MVKKIFSIISLVIILFVLFLVQALILNNVKVLGIVSNLILISVVIVSIYYNKYVCGIYSFFVGLISDVLFSFSIGRGALIYLMISLLIYNIAKFYKRDNKNVYIYLVLIATIFFETIMGILSIMSVKEGINVFGFLFFCIKSGVINLALIYIIYVPLKKYLGFLEKSLG